MKLLICSLFLTLSSNGLLQQKTTMTVIINNKNHIFYYENDLETDGANFKSGDANAVKKWSLFLEKENDTANVSYILKIENKDSLNEISKKLVDYFKSRPKLQQANISAVEKAFVTATERYWGNR
jgi:hypothetical protein